MTDKTRTASPAMIGTPGLNRWAGTISEEFDKRLKGPKGVQILREMSEASSPLGAALISWVAMVLANGWRLDDADESPEAKEMTAFVQSCIDDLEGAFSDTLADIFSCRPFGFSLLQHVYKFRQGPGGKNASKYNDQKIGWRSWSLRAQETILEWEFDDEDRAIAAFQVAPPKYARTRIPLDACLHFVVRGRKGNPAGISVMRNAFESWYYFKHISRIEAIGVERDLAGLPVVKIPIKQYNITADRAPWEQLVTDLRRDDQAGIVIPSDVDPETGKELYSVTLMSTGGTRQIDTDKILGRYERLMLRSLLVDFMTLGDQGVGSFAQSSNRTDMFLQSVKGELQSFQDVINNQGIRRLFEINALDPTLAPTFTFEELGSQDIAAFAAAVVALVGAGIVDPTNADVVRTVYEVIGLPLPEQTNEDQQGGDNLNKNAPPPPPTAPAEPMDQMPPDKQFAEKKPKPVKVTISDGDIAAALDWWAETMPDDSSLLSGEGS